MTDCTERSEGREGVPIQHCMSSVSTPVVAARIRINSVKWLSRPAELERT
jgi:hypothetical protein